MAYSRRHQYTSMRDKNRKHWRNYKAIFVAAFLAICVYIVMNRVNIMDHLRTYFM